jgi:2-polyprenyl-3-methyl-5-hydroxy-6-metoxy-1,4-benzoquinol methylase
MARTEYWNHNVAYHPVVLNAVPAHCDAALDIGCGDGMLARRLAAGPAKHVTGIDASPEMIALARERSAGHPATTFVAADFLEHDLPQEGYDFVCSVAVVHHMDFTAAVTRMARLLRPGGRLVVISIARDATPGDRAIGHLGAVTNKIVQRWRRFDEPAGMPVQMPDMTWSEVRAAARELLPGARYRRHLLWRYSLVWTKP